MTHNNVLASTEKVTPLKNINEVKKDAKLGAKFLKQKQTPQMNLSKGPRSDGFNEFVPFISGDEIKDASQQIVLPGPKVPRKAEPENAEGTQ